MSPTTNPIIVAHRGLHHHSPENSFGAFIDAGRAGVPWIECDVWPSADDAIMIVHDELLHGTTKGMGEVWRHSYEQLHQMRVPALPRVVDYFNGVCNYIPPALLVEIKPDNSRFATLVLDELSRYRFQWMIQSFHPSILYHSWAVNPGTHAALLVQTQAELYRAFESGWPAIHAHYSAIDQKVTDTLHAASRKIGAWTVNDPADIQRMIDLGIDMLITDEPELAMRMIATRSL